MKYRSSFTKKGYIYCSITGVFLLCAVFGSIGYVATGNIGGLVLAVSIIFVTFTHLTLFLICLAEPRSSIQSLGEVLIKKNKQKITIKQT